jgi:hypothetical protein
MDDPAETTVERSTDGARESTSTGATESASTDAPESTPAAGPTVGDEARTIVALELLAGVGAGASGFLLARRLTAGEALSASVSGVLLLFGALAVGFLVGPALGTVLGVRAERRLPDVPGRRVAAGVGVAAAAGHLGFSLATLFGTFAGFSPPSTGTPSGSADVGVAEFLPQVFGSALAAGLVAAGAVLAVRRLDGRR